MRRKKINIHIYPSTLEYESRILKMINAIEKSGFFNKFLVFGFWKRGYAEFEKIDDIKFLIRVRTILNHRKRFFKLFFFIEWSARVLYRLRCEQIGMVNCHSLSSLPLCVLIKVWHGAILIYEPHELETESYGTSKVRIFLTRIIEKLLIKKADHVFVVSESIADWYQINYRITRPTVVFNSSNFKNVIKKNYFHKFFNLRKDKLIFLYQGLLSRGRGIDLLLESFTQRSDDQILIVFMGHGELKAKIELIAKTHKNVFFHPSVHPSRLHEYAACADFGILFTENKCLSYYFSMPNKLFDYIAAGLPVLVSNMKDISQFVCENGVGLVINFASSASINHSINKIIELDRNKLRANVRRAAIENSWVKQERKVLSVFQKMRLQGKI
jgi:glycosyltransferase involved in cell wall biosynthesis